MSLSKVFDGKKSRFECVNLFKKRHLVRKNVMQIQHCGHLICQACISEVLNKGVYTCPGRLENCKKADLRQSEIPRHDLAAENDLRDCMVYCPHQEDGCRDTFTWGKMEQHLESCRFEAKSCDTVSVGAAVRDSRGIGSCVEHRHSEETVNNGARTLRITNRQHLQTTQELTLKNTWSKENKVRKVLLFGLTNSGKSSTGNSIFGGSYTYFPVNGGTAAICGPAREVTRDVMDASLTIIDTPGFTDVSDTESCALVLSEVLAQFDGTRRNPDAIGLVIKYPTRLSVNEKKMIETLENHLGSHFWDHVFVIFTGGDAYKHDMAKVKQTPDFNQFLHSSMLNDSSNSEFISKLCKKQWILINNLETNRDEISSKQAEFLKVVETVHQYTKGILKINQHPSKLCKQHMRFTKPNRIRSTDVAKESSKMSHMPHTLSLSWRRQVIKVYAVPFNGYMCLTNGLLTFVYGFGLQFQTVNQVVYPQGMFRTL